MATFGLESPFVEELGNINSDFFMEVLGPTDSVSDKTGLLRSCNSSCRSFSLLDKLAPSRVDCNANVSKRDGNYDIIIL